MCFGTAKAAPFSAERDFTMKKLTEIEKQQSLKRALTCMSGASERWLYRANTGLNDVDMAKALRYELGIAGGSGCRDSINIHYEGSGFKVWAAWKSFNHCLEEPIFQDDATIKAARLLFGVKNPNDVQLDLF